MKITGYRLEKYIYKIDRGLADANNPSGEDLSIGSLLFLETDEGVTGIAPAGNEKVQDLFQVIEGQDPRSVVWLWKKMDDFVFKGGNQGEAAAAISAISSCFLLYFLSFSMISSYLNAYAHSAGPRF